MHAYIKNLPCYLFFFHFHVADNNNNKFNFFIKPKKTDLKLFFHKHPFQKSNDALIKRSFHRPDGSKRLWLTYNAGAEKSLFCSVCLAFAPRRDCPFVLGFCMTEKENRKHLWTRLKYHEESVTHRDCSKTLLAAQAGHHNRMTTQINNKKSEEVSRNREILKRIIDVIKLIGWFIFLKSIYLHRYRKTGSIETRG